MAKSTKRYSITLSDAQADQLECLSNQGGCCPTAYVYQLVVADLKSAMTNGLLDGKRREHTDVLRDFVLSLVSGEGVDMNVVTAVCESYSIDINRMRAVLGVETVQTIEDVVF